MATEREKQLTAILLKERLERLTGKKVVLKEVKKPETTPSTKPPKKWWDKMVKKQMDNRKSKESADKIVGDIWANKLSVAKKKELRDREGEVYGKPGENEKQTKLDLKENIIDRNSNEDIFEVYDDTDANGPSAEIQIDDLIQEFKDRINDSIKQIDSSYQPGDENKLRIAIKKLWVRKIQEWKSSAPVIKEGFAIQTPSPKSGIDPTF